MIWRYPTLSLQYYTCKQKKPTSPKRKPTGRYSLVFHLEKPHPWMLQSASRILYFQPSPRDLEPKELFSSSLAVIFQTRAAWSGPPMLLIEILGGFTVVALCNFFSTFRRRNHLVGIQSYYSSHKFQSDTIKVFKYLIIHSLKAIAILDSDQRWNR